jgi:arylsulfatase A-like enzyme
LNCEVGSGKGLGMQQLRWPVLAVVLCFYSFHVQSSRAADQPNILWFVVDDMSAHFSSYGETVIKTPHVDRLASEGVLFTDAQVTAPVCSTCRSALMTGCYQQRLGLHHHRSGRGKAKIHLPPSVTPVPVLFQRAGYYTCNGSGLPPSAGGKQRTKTDYNFVWDKKMYDGVDWEKRKPGQPFFMQVQLAGGKLRGANFQSYERIRADAEKTFGRSMPTDAVQLPPYYPDDAVMREDWAAYLDSVRLTDHHVGQVIRRLEREGILDETLIIFMTDHGISHARGKQFLYKEGTHIPFVVRGPGIPRGTRRDDPIEHIDMVAISLAAAGIQLPELMDAKDVFADSYKRRDSILAARDRCDETIDMIRCVRSADYLYVRNFYPFRPHLQPSRYKDGKEIVKRLRQLNAAGNLSPLQQKLLFSRTRPVEELYDLRQDPHELNNLAGDSASEGILEEMRSELQRQILKVRDYGFIPEPKMAELLVDSPQRIHRFARSDEEYPLEAILSVVNEVCDPNDQGAVARLALHLRHENALIRFWALTALRSLDRAQHDLSGIQLESVLSDPDVSVRIAAASLLGGGRTQEGSIEIFLTEAKRSATDAPAFWALDGLKFLDQPEAIGAVSEGDVVKGEYSGRAYQFLVNGGKVY